MMFVWTTLIEILTGLWTIISPIKGYVAVAVLSIFLWQKYMPKNWIEPAGPWAANAQVETITGADSFTVKARTGVFEHTRAVHLDGITIKAADSEAAQSYLTKLLSTDEIILGVTAGARIGRGDLTAVVYTPDGTCANLALICKGLATTSDKTHPEWTEAEQTYGDK